MKTKGIRILDKINRVVSVSLPDILEEVYNAEKYYWSILYVDVIGDLGPGLTVPVFEEQVNESENGLFITWEEINILSKKFDELIDIILIGCEDKDLLKRYEKDRDMYESCDIVINMFDSCFWEVFSKDENLINRLSKKFKDVKFLESDFLEILKHEPNP